jgi:hypothetical protein
VPARDPAIRAQVASIASNTSWANTPDPTARTANGRAAFLSSFERQVDPDGILDPAERTRRAEYLRKAHFRRLALRSAQARANRSGRRIRTVDLPDGDAA